MTPRFLTLAPAVLGLSALLFALGRISAPVETEVATFAPEDAAAELETSAEAIERVELASELSASSLPEGTRRGTARELLEAHYGKSWDEIEAEVGPIPIPSDKAMHLVPWESVAAGFRREVLRYSENDAASDRKALLGWGTKTGQPDWYGSTLNPQKKPLSQIDVQNLEHIASEYDSRLLDAKAEVDALLPVCIADQWDRGGYRKMPFFTTKNPAHDPAKPGGQLMTRVVSSAGGWKVQFRLDSSDYPELDRAAQEMRRRKRERTTRAADYIRGL